LNHSANPFLCWFLREGLADYLSWMASNLPMSYILSLATYNLPSHFVHVPLFWLYIYNIFFLFLFCVSGDWTQGLHLEPLHQLFFCDGFFRDRVSGTICQGWL
jgi:hypothetical protein